MAGASVRRPVPAVVFILLLSLLSAIVWYRVLNRPAATAKKATTPTTHACPTKPATTSKPATPTSRSGTSSPAGTARAVAWPSASTVHLIVLNGTQRAGLAKSVAAQLKTRGFAITTVTNDTVDTASVTQVRYGPRLATAAKLVQLYLPGSRLQPNASQATTVTVSLGSTYSRLSTNAAVAKAKRTVTPATC